MMKLTLALAIATVFTAAAPVYADYSGVDAAAPQVSMEEGYNSDADSLEALTPPNRGRRDRGRFPGRRCFVRDRFRSYDSLRTCYRRSPAPRSCRQVCR